MQKILVAGLFCLVSMLCSVTRAAAADLAVQDGQTVAFLGDSITNMGWINPGGYVRLVNAGLAELGVHITVIPAGVNGNTSQNMLARVNHDVIGKKPQWMTLSCGVNDVGRGTSGVSLDRYKSNIAGIVDQAQAAGIKVLILTSTPIYEDDNHSNQTLAAYNDYLRQLAREKNLPLADLSVEFQKALKAGFHTPYTRLLTVDGIHMNPAGNLIMARGVLTAFGATDADLAKIEAAWNIMPGEGSISSSGFKGATASITIGQFHALESLATARHINVAGLADRVSLDALADVLAKHRDDAPPDLAVIETETQKLFEQRIIAMSLDAK